MNGKFNFAKVSVLPKVLQIQSISKSQKYFFRNRQSNLKFFWNHKMIPNSKTNPKGNTKLDTSNFLTSKYTTKLQ